MAASSDLAGGTAWSCSTCGRAYPADFAVCPLDATPRGEPSRPGDPQIGVVLGHTYRIVRVLGQGGMARLYEAEHLRLDARFAIKIIHDELAREPALLARFEREAHAAARIRSEHVLRAVDVLRTQDDRPCLVTDLLEGEDLQVHLDRVGKLPIAEAIPIARQICRGVAAAHAVGVVHRDLKPSNMFLCQRDATPLVKVLDFGIAKVDDDEDLTRTGAVIGTATYMAPEQARRPADAGPLADVYSIGAIVYHMLAGQPPYGNLPPVSRLALLLNEEPARPRAFESSIPEGLESLIQGAMARDMASRTASVMELERQLVAFDADAGAQTSAFTSEGTTHAQAIAVRARLARPAGVFVAFASSVAAGAWLASLLAALLVPSTRGERTLLAIIGVAAVLAFGGLHLRRLRRIWQSGPAVSHYIAPFAHALLAGVTMFGALELTRLGWVSVAHRNPFGVVVRLLVAAGAAVLGLAWQTWGLRARVARWIS